MKKTNINNGLEQNLQLKICEEIKKQIFKDKIITIILIKWTLFLIERYFSWSSRCSTIYFSEKIKHWNIET